MASSVSLVDCPTPTPSAMAKTNAVLVPSRNVHAGVLQETHLTSHEFLLECPRGAYSIARTCGTTAIPEFQFHMNRLATSFQTMCEEEAIPTSHPLRQEFRDAERVEAAILPPLRRLMQTMTNRIPKGSVEFKTSFVLALPSMASSQTPDDCVFIQMEQYRRTMPRDPCRVVVRLGGRAHAEAKDSQWVRDRSKLKQGIPPGVEDVVMVSEDKMLEGLSSNFFGVRKGTLHTARDGVLAGTIRQLVLDQCQERNIPVVLEAPRLCELDTFQEFFITSTSRLVLPIRELFIDCGEGPLSCSPAQLTSPPPLSRSGSFTSVVCTIPLPKDATQFYAQTLTFEDHPVAQHMRKCVEAALAATSTSIIP